MVEGTWDVSTVKQARLRWDCAEMEYAAVKARFIALRAVSESELDAARSRLRQCELHWLRAVRAAATTEREDDEAVVLQRELMGIRARLLSRPAPRESPRPLGEIGRGELARLVEIQRRLIELGHPFAEP